MTYQHTDAELQGAILLAVSQAIQKLREGDVAMANVSWSRANRMYQMLLEREESYR